jgi:hypothetical protein
MFSELTTNGIIFVALAWSCVTFLTTWCLIKVAKQKDSMSDTDPSNSK